jgi:N-acylneuraminate cytidylyltransferase
VNVAIIPARGGSKRIPRKNIRDFCGKPMIAWSIAAARESGCFERIIVSTDDAEIAEVARAHGAEVPFVRPAALSDDHATTIAVIAHAMQTLVDDGAALDAACCIYATAPLLEPADLRDGLARLRGESLDYVFAMTRFEAPIQRALRVTPEGRIGMFHPEHAATRSQDLEPAFHDAGQFYWGSRDAWLSARPIFGSASAAIELPRDRVQDIDTPDDWVRAELLFERLKRRSA